MCASLFAGRLPAAEYSDKQITLDINAIVALVNTNYDDAVAHFLFYGTSGRKGDSVISTIIARNELNKVGAQRSIHLPLGRLMQRMALRTESAKDARHYAFSQLQWLAAETKEVREMPLMTATEISKRDGDDLKTVASKYLEILGREKKTKP